jgi:dipeptidyl aminopeptidase/acylaminoacyl peptidase
MIAFRRRVANKNYDVYVMRVDGSDVRAVASGPAIEEKPAWSPDGRQLMIISNRDASGKPGKTYDVYVLDRDGGASRPLWADREHRSGAGVVIPLRPSRSQSIAGNRRARSFLSRYTLCATCVARS